MFFRNEKQQRKTLSQLHPITSSITIIFVVIFLAAVSLWQNHHKKHGAQATHAAPESENATDDGFDLSPITILVVVRMTAHSWSEMVMVAAVW